MFAMEYEDIKEGLKDKKGKQIKLEDYLKSISSYGEFDNKMDKPVLEFISAVLDVTIVKPLIEAYLGYDLITKDDLSAQHPCCY